MSNHTNKFTLLYSKKSTKLRSASRAMNNDGKEVEYTEMVDEAKFGKWQGRNGWDDAFEVGYVDGYDQITYISPCEFPETGDVKLDLILMREYVNRAQNKPNKLDDMVRGIVDVNSFN